MQKTKLRDIKTSDTVVELQNVTKSFRRVVRGGLFHREYAEVHALSRINLSVRKGESLAYAGPNGSGKPTTFKLLSGMLAPNEGTIRIWSMDPVRDRIAIMRRTGVLLGNRSELWWDHPVRSSFEWKRDVWDISPKEYAERMERLKKKCIWRIF